MSGGETERMKAVRDARHVFNTYLKAEEGSVFSLAFRHWLSLDVPGGLDIPNEETVLVTGAILNAFVAGYTYNLHKEQHSGETNNVSLDEGN